MSDFLSIAAAAREADVPRSTLRSWIDRGEIALVDGKIPASTLRYIRERAQLRQVLTGREGKGNTAPASKTSRTRAPDASGEHPLFQQWDRGRELARVAVRVLEEESGSGLIRVFVLVPLLSGTADWLEAWSKTTSETDEQRADSERCARLSTALRAAAKTIDAALDDSPSEIALKIAHKRAELEELRASTTPKAKPRRGRARRTT
jgi:hypothetical protein